VQTTLSLGIAQHPGDLTPGEELLRRADSALYAAKGEGRNRVKVFWNRPLGDEVLDWVEIPRRQPGSDSNLSNSPA
jgi:predicted signal transduction protein with EAL and GGDEF domain